MAKVSRPIVYTALFAVVVGAYVFLTQPDAPKATKKLRLTRSSTTNANGISDADLNAHFDRYTGGGRDPFIAGVVPLNPALASAPSLVPTGRAGWALTGVNEVNGIQQAVIENSTTSQSEYLTQGQTWNGLKVVSIAPDHVELQNVLGQTTQLTFAAPPDVKGVSTLPNGTVTTDASTPANMALPSIADVGPLPPLPTDSTSGRTRRRNRGRNRSTDQSVQPTESSN